MRIVFVAEVNFRPSKKRIGPQTAENNEIAYIILKSRFDKCVNPFSSFRSFRIRKRIPNASNWFITVIINGLT